MINSVNLVGNLARDPELRYTPSGLAITTFTVAVNRPFLNQEGQREADFIRIVTWRKLAENCANYLTKGKMVAVEGRLQIRSYETPEGEKKYMTEVVASNVQFMSPPGGAREQYRDQGDPGSMEYGEGNITEEDVPF